VSCTVGLVCEGRGDNDICYGCFDDVSDHLDRIVKAYRGGRHDELAAKIAEAEKLLQDGVTAEERGRDRCPRCKSTNLRFGRNLTGCSDCGWHEEE
jgi:hypothetical protein